MKLFFIILFSALFAIPSVSQEKNKNNKLFNLDVLNFYSTEGTKSRVDVFVEIPLGRLEFKRSKTDRSKFVSKFNLNIDVTDNSGKVIYNNISKEEITTQETGQDYLSNNSQILTRNLFLAPGEYNLKVSISEKSTQKYSETERKINVDDYTAKPLSISDVMIVSRLSQSTGKTVITPDVTRNVGNVDTFYLFYYVYKNNDDEMVDISCNIFDNEKKQVFSKKDIITASEGNIFQNQIFVAVPTAGLAYGKYTIEINAAGKNSTVTENATFENQSFEYPLPLTEIDELIDQLEYIAKDDEMDYMRGGNSMEDRQKRFIDFWKKKDPNPSTRRNEVMQEYYKRIHIADKNFTTTYMKGWKTDMGMVFVIFGPPSNIDKHPFDQDTKPYEIWEYYDINKEFVFVDNSGFGDYRLITPIWETFRYER